MTFLLSMLFGFKRLLSGFLSWVAANPQRIAIVVLIALCGYLALSNVSLRGDVRQKTKIIALRDATIKQMIAQNDAATQKAKANVKRIRELYAEIDEHEKQKLASDRASNRDALSRWLHKNNSGAAVENHCTAVASLPEGTLRHPEEAVIPTAVVSVADLEIASDNFSQLVSLISWAKAIGAVKTTPPE